MAYQIALVDDETEVLKHVAGLFEQIALKLGFSCNLHLFKSPLDVVAFRYDAYFLDIDMLGMDGIHLAQEIRKSGSQSSIIFVSSVEEKVFEALRVQPFRFVRKSRLEEEMKEALTALQEHMERERQDILTISFGRETLNLNVHNILYVEGQNKIQLVVTRDRTHTVYSTMQFFEEQLEKKRFFRIQRSFLVNMNAVICIRKGEAVLVNGTHLPISREKYAQARQIL